MKKIFSLVSLFAAIALATSCSSECNCGDSCTCDQYCTCTKCKHNQGTNNGNVTPVPGNSYGIPDDSQAGVAPTIASGESNTNIPNIQTSITGDGNSALMTINMTGVLDPSTSEWVALAGTGQNGQNVWVTVDDKPKSIVVYNNDGDDGEAVLADIVFTVDNSGSMYEEADAIARDIVNWAQLLSQSGLSVKFGVVGYGDNAYGVDGALNMTDAAALDNYLSSRGNSGTRRTYGFAGPDAARLTGLALSENNGYYNGAYNECGAVAIRFADREFDFRQGANRIYVNFTDESNQPGGYTDFSTEFFKNQENWRPAQGTIHTVFSEDTLSYYQSTEQMNFFEKPWRMSWYTGGTFLTAPRNFQGVSLQSLPVTGAMQHSYIIRFTNISEFMDGQMHKVLMTICTPDGHVKAVKEFWVTFGGQTPEDN